MDKKEQRTVRSNYILLVLGVLLALALIILNRGGLEWVNRIAWSELGWLQWLVLAVLVVVGLLAQFFMLLLLRYSKLRYLILVGIPVIWLFNNGIIAMSRFLDWTTDIGATIGWLSVADLISWLAGAVYFPVLVSLGAVSAILDSSASMLTSSCYYARMALEITNVSPWQVVDFSTNVLSITWDMIANSFTQEVIKATSDTDSLFEFSLTAALSLPSWLTSVGYSLSCLCL